MSIGAFGENFPYTNFHNLNMDWVIQIIKEFRDQYTHIQEIIDNGEESLSNLTTEEIERLQQELTAVETALQAISESTLNEFRNDANEKTAECIESIPADYTAWASRVSQLKLTLERGLNIVQLCTYTDFVDGYYASIVDGSLVPNADFCASPFMPVTQGDYIFMYGSSGGSQLVFYDANQNFISGIATGLTEAVMLPMPSAVRYIKWSTTVSQKNTSMAGVWKCTLCKELDTLKNLVYGLDIIDHNSFTDGYYASSIDGSLVPNSAYTVTSPIRILPGAKLRITGGVAGSQIALYDNNMGFISGYALPNSTAFIVPENENIKFCRWGTLIENKNIASISLEIIPSNSQMSITPATGLLNGLITAHTIGKRKIIVEPGEYDIIAEYKAQYGASYFDTYLPDYNNLTNGAFDRGLWLNNMEITFEPGCSVSAHYTGDNENVKRYFSAFAVGSNVTIKGLKLSSSNLRYGIHPDFATTPNEYLTIDSCELDHVSDNTGIENRAIGAGLGVHSNWVIKNCIFGSTGNYDVVSIHNNASADAKSQITISDCYISGEGYIRIASYSSSTNITHALIHGCSWVTEPILTRETPGSNNNMDIIKWNNETRN